jgi:hypothetical protein
LLGLAVFAKAALQGGLFPGDEEEDEAQGEGDADVHPVGDVGHGEPQTEGAVEDEQAEDDGADEELVELDEFGEAEAVPVEAGVVQVAEGPLEEDEGDDDDADDLVGAVEWAGLG